MKFHGALYAAPISDENLSSEHRPQRGVSFLSQRVLRAGPISVDVVVIVLDFDVLTLTAGRVNVF